MLTDAYIILVKDNDLQGQFLFPKEVLAKHGILSTNQAEGKRGFRLYPAWVQAQNQTASKTQSLFLPYFTKIDDKILL
ncbi:MAG: hypothetical protein CMF49_09305 [Legionellales bacterium]|nr:hypothetical protein [Legionellales bacterium]|tara:strand:- start:523 stop:756 length:234 start_codon:yes stop_codon:yes gene_type:complete